MGNKIELTGQRFGKWTVLSLHASPKGYEHLQYWLCVCDCGVKQVRKGSQLRWAEKKGMKQACIVCGATSHGMTKTPIYRIWVNMRHRCNNPRSQAFERYGARGIKVCDRWQESFENFLADMGERPSLKHSIDRIDNNGNYEPDNCRWATVNEQTRNQSNNHNITFNGKTQCISAWANEVGFSDAVIRQRIVKHGWSIEKALTVPVDKPDDWVYTSHKAPVQYTYNGETHSITEWSKLLSIPNNTLYGRIAKGWPLDRVFSTEK